MLHIFIIPAVVFSCLPGRSLREIVTRRFIPTEAKDLQRFRVYISSLRADLVSLN